MEYRREPVIGFEEYEVDTNGVVYSKNGKPLKYSLNHGGYCIVNFYINHKRTGFGIHTLVAKQFIPNSDPLKTQVNHKDGNKQNNSVENLEWTTPTENMRHSVDVLGNMFGENSPRALAVVGLDKKTGEEIYYFPSLSDAARYFNEGTPDKKMKAKKQAISAVLHGRKKSYLGCVWKVVPKR